VCAVAERHTVIIPDFTETNGRSTEERETWFFPVLLTLLGGLETLSFLLFFLVPKAGGLRGIIICHLRPRGAFGSASPPPPVMSIEMGRAGVDSSFSREPGSRA
jgi:hypothetical protein